MVRTKDILDMSIDEFMAVKKERLTMDIVEMQPNGINQKKRNKKLFREYKNHWETFLQRKLDRGDANVPFLERLSKLRFYVFHNIYYCALPLYECKYCQSRTYGKASYLLCSRCEAVHYCSEKCQREHWPTHRAHCKEDFSEQVQPLNKWIRDVTKNENIKEMTQFRDMFYEIISVTGLARLSFEVEFVNGQKIRNVCAREHYDEIEIASLNDAESPLVIQIWFNYKLSDNFSHELPGDCIASRGIALCSPMSTDKRNHELILIEKASVREYKLLYKSQVKSFIFSFMFIVVLVLCGYFLISLISLLFVRLYIL